MTESRGPVDEVIDALVVRGDGPTDPRERFRMIVAAADATDDDVDLWRLGDLPVDMLVGDEPEAAQWFHDARRDHPGVERMFRAMRDPELNDGPKRGWWADEGPPS